jgi:hypothetical protein
MGSARKPGPMCSVTNPVDIDTGTLIRHGSPQPGPVCGPRLTHRHAPVEVGTVIFDEDQIVGFLESVAHAKAAERHIKLVWKDYDESTVINVIYALMPWKAKPGILEVDPGDIHQILNETKAESEKLQEQFVHKLSRGADEVAHFMNAQEKIRSGCLDTIQSVYREASQLNDEMRNEARRGVARLTLIKAASTITFKAAALVGGGLPAFLIGTGYDVTLNLIDEWDEAPDAKMIGVRDKLVDKLWKKGAKDAAKNMAYILKEEETAPARKADWLRKRLKEMEDDLENQASARRLKKFAKDSRRLARAEQEAARAKWGSRAFSSVKFVFFAWDVYNAAQDAGSTFKKAGYESTWDALKDAF